MREKIIAITIALISVLILVFNFVFLQKEQMRADENRNRLLMLQKLETISEGIQSEFNTSLQYANFFDVIISKNPEIPEEIIYDYAQSMMKQNKNIKSVQLAPQGIVSIIYPLEGNEAAIGHDLMSDPDRKKFVEEAISTRKSVTQGPVEAKQGGFQVFNRKAIFTKENGEDKFWGLSIIAIDFDELMEKYKPMLKNEGYLLALKATHTDENKDFMWGDCEIFDKDVIIKKIVLPDNEWEIAIYPENGRVQENSNEKGLTIFFYMIALLAFMLIYQLVKFYQEKIEAAKKDILTGTLNKSAFKAFTQKQLLQKGQQHGVILMDLNDFKAINDKFGHPVGDAVLIEVAKRIKKTLRSADRVSRFGGDEYIIFINSIKDEETMEQIVARMVESISLPMTVENLQLNIYISAGYCIYPDEGKFFEELYKIADQRMYENKKSKTTKENRTSRYNI